MPRSTKKDSSKSTRNGPVRYAVVGLGYIAQTAVLPAFAHTENSVVTALVSGDSAKLKKLGRKYAVRNLYSYEEYDAMLKSGEIDAVYIALPNDMHRSFTIRAARAGIHVLCEKPMAVDERECEAMIRACEHGNVKLMIAYRLHFEETNMKAAKLVESGKIGEPRLYNAIFTMQVRPPNIRLQADKGGGTLYDIGIYCINAARYMFRDEPTEVFAWTASNGEERFGEIEEMTCGIIRFPNDRLASFECSFGTADVATFQVMGTTGSLTVDHAFEFVAEMKHTLVVKGKKSEQTFPPRDQFAPELIYFSRCILDDRDPEPSGYEGLIDVQIIRALYKSARTGKPVTLELEPRTARPTIQQEMKRPKVAEPTMVKASPPSKPKSK
jgi:glucose-fructose oxidoreductase